MASEAKKRKCKRSIYNMGYMKADGKFKRCGIFHKRHRQQLKKETFVESNKFI